ncbi:uncharacterized protein LOC143842419 isoform X1 [Paroedura picta]|uniref:uncharacterized protein LOC143842419 isoform X1 n=1 Tax=Paroedura picta TaxID=143630 RepID=UPI0040573B3C
MNRARFAKSPSAEGARGGRGVGRRRRGDARESSRQLRREPRPTQPLPAAATESQISYIHCMDGNTHFKDRGQQQQQQQAGKTRSFSSPALGTLRNRGSTTPLSKNPHIPARYLLPPFG